MPVRDIGQQSLLEPDAPQSQAFGVATRAEVAALARERQEIFVLTGTAAHAGETVLHDPAGEELVDLVVDRAELFEVIVDEAI